MSANFMQAAKLASQAAGASSVGAHFPEFLTAIAQFTGRSMNGVVLRGCQS